MPNMVNALAWTARHTPLGRGATRRLMVKVARKLATGPIRTAFRGVPIIVYPDTFKPVFSLAYDRPEMDFLWWHLQSPEAVFVDIGANFGLYSQWLGSKMASTAKLIAIEPSNKCVRLRQNLSLLKSKPEIAIFNCAVGDHEGFVHFEKERVTTSGPQVPVRPLFDIVQEAGCKRVSALKIDIEGYEDRALTPFISTAPKSLLPEAIVIEHVHSNEWNEDIIERLCASTYKIVKKTRANLLMQKVP